MPSIEELARTLKNDLLGVQLYMNRKIATVYISDRIQNELSESLLLSRISSNTDLTKSGPP